MPELKFCTWNPLLLRFVFTKFHVNQELVLEIKQKLTTLT